MGLRYAGMLPPAVADARDLHPLSHRDLPRAVPMTKTRADALVDHRSDADLRAAKIRMGQALPDEGWLADYLRAVTPLTDAPAEFHLVSGLCALSAAIGNKLWTVEWGQNVFPHLWAVLVAPSSFWRKSTAINQAERLLRTSADPAPVYPTEFSREKLLKLLSEVPAGLLTIKEFGGFLSMLGRDYMSGSKETLTELYDGPEVYTRALAEKTFTIARPALTLLGATTMDWLEAKITEGDLQGGFLARFLFVTATEKASPKALTGDIDPTLQARLSKGLHLAHEFLPVKVEYSADARELYSEWMLGWEAEVGATPHRSDLSGFAVRLQTYALKLAMLYRVSATLAVDETSADFHVLDRRSVEQAIAYCRHLWLSVTGLIDDNIAITKDAQELRRLGAIIGSGITRSDALRLSHLKARDFALYVDTLVQQGAIHRTKVRASEVGLDRQRDSQVEWLSPTPVLLNGHSMDDFESAAAHSTSLGRSSSGSQELEREPQEGVNSSYPEEPEGAESLSEELVVTSSLSLPTPTKNAPARRGDTRARENPSDVRLVEDDDDGDVTGRVADPMAAWVPS